MAAVVTMLLWSALAAWGFVTAVVVAMLLTSVMADAVRHRDVRHHRWSVEDEFRRQLDECSHVPDDWS